MLKKLFESLDEKVFTDDLKESLEASFNEAVELKAVELAEAKITELTETHEEMKLQLQNEATEKEAALIEKVDSFLEKVVEEFVTEAKDSLDESLKAEKADLMIEAFDSMIIAGGVEVQRIVEAKIETDVETKLAESIEKYDSLIEDNIALEKENANLMKMGVIAEMKEGMSIIEAERFAKLAEMIDFEKTAEYASKLDTLKESVQSTKVVTDEVTKKVNESATKKSYAHLI